MISVDEINKLNSENLKMKKFLLNLKNIAIKNKLYKGFHYGYMNITEKFLKELDELEIKL